MQTRLNYIYGSSVYFNKICIFTLSLNAKDLCIFANNRSSQHIFISNQLILSLFRWHIEFTLWTHLSVITADTNLMHES